jgi:sodium-coupled monocarboxylate transporter 8/12
MFYSCYGNCQELIFIEGKKRNIAMETFFSLVSGITVMGDPSEIYTYGTLYWLACFCAPPVGILNNYLYLPVFYELQITSVYEVCQDRSRPLILHKSLSLVLSYPVL